jgi:hypothetical protein
MTMMERRESVRYWFDTFIPVGIRGANCQLMGRIANLSESGLMIWLEYQVNEPQPDEAVIVEIGPGQRSYDPGGKFVRCDQHTASIRFEHHFRHEMIADLLLDPRRVQ